MTNINAAGSNRTVELPPGLDSLPEENAILSLKNGLDRGIKDNDEALLRTAVNRFRDAFPTLSLWERFKDFFGLSDTADNRRDAAALCITSVFHSGPANTMSTDEYEQSSRMLVQILQDTGLAPVCDDTELEILTADTLARLLARNSVPEELITLTEAEILTFPETGAILLIGQVEFSDAENTPGLLRNLRLPFAAMAASSLNGVAEQMGEEGGTALKTLYGYLPPETQRQVQQQFELSEGPRKVLFSQDGLLGELNQPDSPNGLSGAGPWVLTQEQQATLKILHVQSITQAIQDRHCGAAEALQRVEFPPTLPVGIDFRGISLGKPQVLSIIQSIQKQHAVAMALYGARLPQNLKGISFEDVVLDSQQVLFITQAIRDDRAEAMALEGAILPEDQKGISFAGVSLDWQQVDSITCAIRHGMADAAALKGAILPQNLKGINFAGVSLDRVLSH